MIVRFLTAADLPDIARVHRSAFREGGVAALGQGTTERYYGWQLSISRRPTMLGVNGPDGLRGFTFAAETFGSMSAFVRSSAASVCGALIVRPWVVWHVRRQIVTALTPSSDVNRQPPSSAGGAGGEKRRATWLHAIGVRADQQRRGIGGLLMRASEEVAREQGYEEMFLAVRTDNEPAIKLYESLGWIPVLNGSTWRGRMKKSLTAATPAGAGGPSSAAALPAGLSISH